MAEEKKEIRIAARLPVAIVDKIDEAVAAGLGETRSGFIREVVARHFESQAESLFQAVMSRIDRMEQMLDDLIAARKGVEEGAANGSEKGKEKTETEVKNGSTKEAS